MGAHDALFRDTFSVPARAAGLLRTSLPARIAALVDWSTLARVPSDRIDRRLRERRSDLVFEARLAGRDAYFLVLVEHQSTPDPRMVLRSIEYALGFWRDAMKVDRGAALPPVVPVVVHHGARGWTAARALRDLYALEPGVEEALAPHVLSLEILVDDLARVSPEDIMARHASALVRLVLGMLRDTRRSRDVGELLSRWAEPLREVLGDDPLLDALLVVFRYIAQVRNEELGEVVEAARRIGPDLEEATVTLYDRLMAKGEAKGRAEGKAEGKAEGEAKGKAEVVLKLLHLRFGALPAGAEARVRGASLEQLDRFAERVLDAGSVGEVIAD